MGKLALIFSGINDQLEALRIEKAALQLAAERIVEINAEIDKLRAVKQDMRTRFGDAEVSPDVTPEP